MKKRMYIWAKTDIRGREENQDSFLIDSQSNPVEEDCEANDTIDYTDNKNDIHMAMVADGVSRSIHGKMAAITALEWAKVSFEKHKGEVIDLEELSKLMVDAANTIISEDNHNFGIQAATTLSMLLWSGTDYCISNIGDSPVYLFRDNKLLLISEPQTYGNFLRKKRRRGSSEDDNSLLHYIGCSDKSGRDMVHISKGELKDGDAFLLCTDGLTKVLSDKVIETQLKNKSMSKMNRTFWSLLDKKGEKDDNCTVVLLQTHYVNELRTEIVDGKLRDVDSFKQLEAFWEEYKQYEISWKEYISGIVKRIGLSKSELYKRINPLIKEEPDWLKKNTIPANRDELVFLGIAGGFSLREVNDMLKRAGFHELYVKDMRDAVMIFIIEKRKWKINSEPVKDLFNNMYAYALDKQSKYLGKQNIIPLRTEVFFKRFQKMSDFDKMLDELFENNSDNYRKLKDYVMMEFEWDKEVGGTEKGFIGSAHTKRKYKDIIEALIKYNQIPSRVFLIAYGSQRSYNLKLTNSLLEAAGMAPLYSKDVLEHLIIYFLQDPGATDPWSDPDEEGQFLVPGDYISVADYLNRELIKYIKKLRKKGQEREADLISNNETYISLMKLYS